MATRVTRQFVEVASKGTKQGRVTQQAVEILSETVYLLPPATAYATLAEAKDYFTFRLHAKGWSSASPVNQRKALITATRLIDTLNFKGHKHTVYQLLHENGCGQNISYALDRECVTEQELQDANLAQPLEFPRDADTDVPQEIKEASFEIANALLDDIDPEIELENLAVFTNRMMGVSTSSERRNLPVEHTLNYIPSAVAWSWIKPFLIDEDAIKITRIT